MISMIKRIVGVRPGDKLYHIYYGLVVVENVSGQMIKAVIHNCDTMIYQSTQASENAESNHGGNSTLSYTPWFDEYGNFTATFERPPLDWRDYTMCEQITMELIDIKEEQNERVNERPANNSFSYYHEDFLKTFRKLSIAHQAMAIQLGFDPREGTWHISKGMIFCPSEGKEQTNHAFKFPLKELAYQFNEAYKNDLEKLIRML